MRRWTVFLLSAWLVLTAFPCHLIGGVDERLEEVRKEILEKEAKWEAGITSLSNIPLDVAKRYCGVLAFPEGARIGLKEGVTTDILPDSLDWRNYNGYDYTTPIKDQGHCGSCWAFGGLATLEAGTKILCDIPDINVDLSEQYLLSCSGGSCSGWMMEPLFDFLQRNGVVDEECFPYQAVDTIPCSDKCPDWEYRVKKIKDWDLLSQSVEVIKGYLFDGPLSATMLVYEDFYYYYTGGVYEHISGGLLGGHAVCLVGWNDRDSSWICKNSWGTDWGEAGASDSAGWFRIKMGENECGIENGCINCQMEDIGTPSPPFNVNAVSLDHSVQLTWNDPSVDVYGFPITIDEIRIYRGAKDTDSLIDSVGASVECCTDEELPNGEHIYYLQATNDPLSGHMVRLKGWSGPFDLEDGGVNQSAGTDSTVFTLFCLYHSPDNYPPDQSLVYLDGIPNELSTLDYDYSDGSFFNLDTTLGHGIHSYYFLFSSQGDTIRYPETGEIEGPMVGWISFADDMEEGTGDWSHTHLRPGYLDEWHLTNKRNHTSNGSQSWWCGNEVFGAYSDKVDAVLVSPEINIDSISYFTFWHWMDIEREDDSMAWDGGIVEISTDGGSIWNQIFPIGGYPYKIEYNPASPFSYNTACFSGCSDWTLAQFKITGYDFPVKFRFHFGSDSYVTGEGWYIDDVIVYISSEIGVEESDSSRLVCKTYRLLQNYPNPFRETTEIKFYLPHTAYIDLSVYNILGQKVTNLIDGKQSAGYKSVKWDARGVANGLYFYRLRAPGYIEIRNMILLH